MPDWVVTILVTVGGALLISYGNKRISEQASKLTRVQAEHEKEMARAKADHETQISTMRATFEARFESMNAEITRLRAEVVEVRSLYGPAQSELRALYDYAGVLRHGYDALGQVAPPWPAELRGK
jgi:hypothetical protein